MSDNSGHRARLLERYERGGLNALADYEVLELLLTIFIPRRDTKALAKKLIGMHGSIGEVLKASKEDLSQKGLMTERAAILLGFLRDVTTEALSEKIRRREYIKSKADVVSFLRAHYANAATESIIALYVDSQNRVIKHEKISEGTVDHCTLYPRELFDRAFRCKAASIILVHNHPGGSVAASEADWALTERIHKTGSLLNVHLIDHIIIADGEAISLRESPRWPH